MVLVKANVYAIYVRMCIKIDITSARFLHNHNRKSNRKKIEYYQRNKRESEKLISPEWSNVLPSVGGGLTVKAIERKEGLECAQQNCVV